MKKTAKQVWLTGAPEQFTPEHTLEIVRNLYDKGLAEAWFCGMGWPEGYRYCDTREYVLKTAHQGLMTHNRQALWFACRFLD